MPSPRLLASAKDGVSSTNFLVHAFAGEAVDAGTAAAAYRFAHISADVDDASPKYIVTPFGMKHAPKPQPARLQVDNPIFESIESQ